MFRQLTCSLTLSLVLLMLASGYVVAAERPIPHSMSSDRTLMLAENGAQEKRRHAPKTNANRKQAPLGGDTATHEKRVVPEAMSSGLPTRQFTPSNGNNDARTGNDGGITADDNWEARKRSPGAAIVSPRDAAVDTATPPAEPTPAHTNPFDLSVFGVRSDKDRAPLEPKADLPD